MKILAITEDYPVIAGGYFYFIRICEALSTKAEVTTVACHGATDQYSEKLKRIGPKKLSQALFPLFLTWFLLNDRKKYDSALINWGASQFFALIMLKLMRIPAVLIVHHTDTLWEHVKFSPNKVSSKIYAIIQYLCTMSFLQFFDAILVENSVTEEIMRNKNRNVFNIGIAICRY
ncbi:Uncharacterised protein [uncultured archaeon]|nr:Uncharacterised protein [uncultured archaeon]